MSKQEMDRIRLEERAKILAKASEEVSEMLKEMAASDNPPGKGKKVNAKPKENQKKKNPPNARGSKSYNDLSSGSSHGRNEGSAARGGHGGRGRQRGNYHHGNQNKTPNPSRPGSQQLPPSYDEAVQEGPQYAGNPQHAGNPQYASNPQHAGNPQQQPFSNQQFAQYPVNQYAGNPMFIQANPYLNQFPQIPTRPQYYFRPNFNNNAFVPPQRGPAPHPQRGPAPHPQRGPAPPLIQNPPPLMQNPPPLLRNPQPNVPPQPKPFPRKTSLGVFVDLYLLVDKLSTLPGFFTNVDALSKLVNAKYEDTLKVIKNNCGIFSTLKDDSKKDSMVELCPTVKMCKGHLGKNGCTKAKCFDLHICQDFVNDSCSEKTCAFGHFWKTNHNDFIFRNFRLDRLSKDTLHKLMQKVFSGQITPKICFQYHQQTCKRGESCTNLHICYSFVTTLGNCVKGDQCPYNHNIRENSCKAIIEKCGISTNESPRDLLKILADRCKGSEDSPNSESSEPSAAKQDTGNKKQKEKSNDSGARKKEPNNSANPPKKKNEKAKPEQMSNKQPTKDQQSSNKQAPKATKTQTIFSWNFKGNVEEPSICSLALDGKCPDLQKGCKQLHSKGTFCWQFGTDKNWYNFHAFHVLILEKHFRDVNCNDTVLPKLDPEKVNPNIKDLFSLLGNKSIKVDFLNMMIDCESNNHVYSIRQLTTESSAVSDSKHSTTFTWYFEDDDDKWKVFGKSESSSQTIERAYQNDPSKPIMFTSPTTNFSYEINFSNMTQLNLETRKERDLKRRPKPFPMQEDDVGEKFNIPRHWEPMNDDEEYKTVYLHKNSHEFQNIRQIFQLTLPTTEIVTISRIQNVHIWKQFCNKKSELQKKYKENYLNTQKLFIGLNSQDVQEICRDNLDWRIHDPDGTKPYGNGTYFYNSAAVASKSCTEDFLGHQKLLVAEVIIGCVTEGSPNLTRPPENPQFDKLFDTTTDDVTSPTVFVKYNKQEYYPTHIVEFL